MTSTKLARHYDTLAPAERLSLLLAAGARGDDVEHARLADSAPKVTWNVPHTFGRALALLLLASQQRMKLLELAGMFFRARAVADQMEGENAERMTNVAGVYGYLFRAQSEGWARFCDAERLDPTVCEQAAPGADVLNIATDEAEAFGFTEAQTRDHLKREGKADPDALLTAASVEAQVREGFYSLLKNWE